MDVILIIALVLALLIVALLVVAATKPNSFRVERSQTIAAPPSAVYENLVDFRRWMEWSPWEGRDPDQVRTYTGPDRGVGASYAWKGNRNVGQGQMEITDAVEFERVALDLHFIKPFKAQNLTEITLRENGGTTEVNWAMSGPSTFMSKVMSVFVTMDKMVGPDFEKGLAQLKTVSEA